MLAVSGVLLVAAAYGLLTFTYHVCRHRPASFWASETAVLVLLAPAILVSLAAAGMCFAKFLIGGVTA